jgi:hypothetical protein
MQRHEPSTLSSLRMALIFSCSSWLSARTASHTHSYLVSCDQMIDSVSYSRKRDHILHGVWPSSDNHLTITSLGFFASLIAAQMILYGALVD